MYKQSLAGVGDAGGDEPPPLSREAFVDTLLERARALQEGLQYTSFIIGRQATRVVLAEGLIVADGGQAIYGTYHDMSLDARQSLEVLVAGEMRSLAGAGLDDARVFCNRVPILFEPTSHAMLLGTRNDEQRSMRFEAHDVTGCEQQILLGGLGVLLWWLDENR